MWRLVMFTLSLVLLSDGHPVHDLSGVEVGFDSLKADHIIEDKIESLSVDAFSPLGKVSFDLNLKIPSGFTDGILDSVNDAFTKSIVTSLSNMFRVLLVMDKFGKDVGDDLDNLIGKKIPARLKDTGLQILDKTEAEGKAAIISSSGLFQTLINASGNLAVNLVESTQDFVEGAVDIVDNTADVAFDAVSDFVKGTSDGEIADILTDVFK